MLSGWAPVAHTKNQLNSILLVRANHGKTRIRNLTVTIPALIRKIVEIGIGKNLCLDISYIFSGFQATQKLENVILRTLKHVDMHASKTIPSRYYSKQHHIKTTDLQSKRAESNKNSKQRTVQHQSSVKRISEQRYFAPWAQKLPIKQFL